jgi:DNA-binding SARP family transcriptional activator
MLRLRLLGGLIVEVDGRPVAVSGSWRARSLLAWLALHPGDHPRADLAPRFWPDVLDTSARASLRNALWALRRTLGAGAGTYLVSSRQRIGLAPDVWVDTLEFDRLAREGRVEEAVELCRGELLAGLDEEWIDEQRDAHRDALAAALEQLERRAEERGDLPGAIALTRRRAALDPLAEEAQQDLMRRLAAGGRRSEALVEYAKLRDRLRRALGISPSSATRALAEQLREEPAAAPTTAPAPRGAAGAPAAGAWVPGMPFPLPARLAVPGGVGFAGRSGELGWLRERWRAVRRGAGPSLALVTGDAGIGKTRLAFEFARATHAQGAVVLYGSAQYGQLTPHQPFSEALGHLVRSWSPAALASRLGPAAAPLGRLVPELADIASARAAVAPEVVEGRFAMFEAAASLLAELSADVPVLLVADDLHCADPSAAALLRHVLESRPGARLLLLATCRSGELAADDPVADALQRLARDGLLEELALAGLARTDVACMIAELAGGAPRAEVADAVHRETGGNPLFVREVVRDLEDSGAGAAAVLRTAVPRGVRDVVARRLVRLSDPCLRLLCVAAVLGPQFGFAALGRVSELDEEQLATVVDEAVAAGLVVEIGGPQELFAFSHGLIRRTLEERLTAAHRRRIHARVADALQDDAGDALLAEIAYHLCEAGAAGDPAKAVDYAARAAEQAIFRLAYAEAVEHFSRALALVPAGDGRRRELTLRRAFAHMAATHQLVDAGRRDGSAEAPAPA